MCPEFHCVNIIAWCFKSGIAVVTLFFAYAGPLEPAQERGPQSGSSAPGSGRQTFAVNCAECHALDGGGSERGPNIASAPRTQRLSDTQIVRIISGGMPGTGMPGFHALGKSGVAAVVAYLRVLQGRGKSARLPGDPQRGKAVFFGEAGCSTCHMIAGAGGFLAPDLSYYANPHTVEEIREAITNPASRNSRKGSVTAVTRDGQEYKGMVRNEDNFSLQLQSGDGSFHLLLKSDLQRIQREPQSSMPSDYASKLSKAQLDDLVSYLLSVGQAAKPRIPASHDDE
jgi:cytochrome c oxidase cbb3-type subunit 3